MNQRIGHITLLVHDYDEAIEFYTQKLDFEIIEDVRLNEHKRWVVLCPNNDKECSILLSKATDDIQRANVGNQAGGRVFLFLFTDDFYRDYHKMSNKGVRFIRPPKHENYGIVAVFEDLYGNFWDLIEPKELCQPD